MKPAPPVTRIGPGTTRQAIASARVPDVILPVLNERAAIPWVLERMPAGYAPLVVDNGSTDGSGELAAALGARVVTEPQPGFGAACFAGLSAAESDDRVLHGLRRVVRSGRSAAGRRSRSLAGDGGPDARRPPARPRAAPGRSTPAPPTPCWRSNCDAGRTCRYATSGPMRAAPRERLLALGIRDRRFGWPLEMVLRAADRGLDDPRGRRRLPPARRRARRSPAPCAEPPAPCGI